MNMGKIVNALKWMKIVLNRAEKNPKFHSRFSDSMGILRAAEKCNGSEIETALSWWKYVSKLSSDAK
jgi:hypothetical protein